MPLTGRLDQRRSDFDERSPGVADETGCLAVWLGRRSDDRRAARRHCVPERKHRVVEHEADLDVDPTLKGMTALLSVRSSICLLSRQ